MRQARFAGLIGSSATIVASAWLASCLPRSDEPYQRQTDDSAGEQGPVQIDGGSVDPARELPDAPPHAILSVAPNHGSFNGGQTVLIRGNGFKSDVRIWFGDKELEPEQVVPVDSGRVQVTVPPGSPGPVDVIAQNGSDASTRARLPAAYIYDAFYVEPRSGPSSGGTSISLFGAGTEWNDDTRVLIDLAPCEDVVVASETELTCSTPEGSAGSKTVRVIDGEVEVDVLDAFTYGDSETGFRGGLSGQPLDSELNVTVLDNYTGSAVPGAVVIAGSDPESRLVETTNSKGVAGFSGSDLGPTQTITVAAKCFSPVSFVDVPVDTVNVYLDPVLDISCADLSELPTLPGTRRGSGSSVRGQLIWPARSEFGRDGWSNVPLPRNDSERLVAYVFRAFNSATGQFRLPSVAAAVTPTADGDVGYDFFVSALPGNATYYALAGVENRSLNPPLFTAYSMGVAKGVTTQPDTSTVDVFIPLDVPLDHTLTLELAPPQATLRGPDRVRANVVIKLWEAGYALLPMGRQERLLPGGGQHEFVGVPPLVGSLAGAQYVAFGEAVTGETAGLPSSFGGLFATTQSDQPLPLQDFLEVPLLEHPSVGTRWDGQRLEVSWAAGGSPVDLVVFDIQSGGGLITWTVAAPGSTQSIQLPDLRELSKDIALAAGPISIRVTTARIDELDYGSLRYRQLRPQGFDAFARDAFPASY